MREVTATLGDKEVTLVANFKASVQIAEKIADPLFIFRETGLEFEMMQKGLTYQPRFMFDVKNVPSILHIGLTAGGEKWKMEEVQELVFEAGFLTARAVCMEYIATLVTPMPEEEVEGAGDKSPGE